MAGGAKRLAEALVLGLLGAAAVHGVMTTPIRIEPGQLGWQAAVRGATRDGAVKPSALLRIPGLDRRLPAQLVIHAEAIGSGTPELGVGLEGGTFVWARADRDAVWALPPSDSAGLWARLATAEGRPIRLRGVEVRGESRGAWRSALWVFLVVTAVVGVLSPRVAPFNATALGLLLAGACALFSAPLLLWWRLPALDALGRLGLAGLLVGIGLGAGLWRPTRRRFALAAVLGLATLSGAWVRGYFLPSAGSWDTDYWKACTRRVVSQGVTRAYGDPEAVSLARFLDRAAGREPLWEVEGFGRTFVVDQPPGIMTLWGLSSRWVRGFTDLRGDEAENAAAKLPAIFGDLLSVGLLLAAFPGDRGRALAAIYWALPISWLSSSVLGYFDGAHAPFTVAALLVAGRGRSGVAGLLLAIAGLVKSTALMVAPAVAVALHAARRRLGRAIAAGLALVALVAIPFALEGTLATAAVHMLRIFFQKRLSGGFANGWWLLGYVLSLSDGSRRAIDLVPFVQVGSVPFPVNALGVLLFLAVALHVGTVHRRFAGSGPAALAGATLILTYAMVAVGVHENHPHALVLALLATGLRTRRMRWLAAIFLTTYVVNLFALSGLGRFYGRRYMALDGLIDSAAGFRMALGFDVTLVLGVVNLLAFAVLLTSFRREMEQAE